MERPLVLGGTGFLGFNIIHALLDQGLTVRATRRPTSIALLLRKLKTVDKVMVDFDDQASVKAAAGGCDVAFMAAGHYPRYSVDPAGQVDTARRRMTNVLEGCRQAGVRRLVYTGSVTTVGPPPAGEERPADERDRWNPPPEDSVYFQVKEALEETVLAWAGPPDVVVACPTGCLGEYGYKSGTGFFILGLAHGSLPYLVDGPVNIVYARDAADAHVAAALQGRPGERYILGGHNITVRALLEEAARALGVAPPAEELPLDQALERNRAEELACAEADRGRPTVPVEFLDMLRYGHPFSSARAVAELGFRVTPLEDIVDRTIAWYRANGFLPKT